MEISSVIIHHHGFLSTEVEVLIISQVRHGWHQSPAGLKATTLEAKLSNLIWSSESSEPNQVQLQTLHVTRNQSDYHYKLLHTKRFNHFSVTTFACYRYCF